MTGWGAVRERYRVAADPLRTERKVELAAVVLGALLCLQLLYSGARLAMAPAFDVVTPAADALQVKRVDHPATVSSSQSDEIRARPLFWQARRPTGESMAEVAPESGGKKAGKLKEVKLLGVFGSGDMAGIIALVKDKKRRILQGESVAGWTLEVVEPNRVVLVDGERREELVLKTGMVIAAADTGVANSSAGRPVAEQKKPATNKQPPATNKQKPATNKQLPATNKQQSATGKSKGGGAPAGQGGERRLSPGGSARAFGSNGQ